MMTVGLQLMNSFRLGNAEARPQCYPYSQGDNGMQADRASAEIAGEKGNDPLAGWLCWGWENLQHPNNIDTRPRRTCGPNLAGGLPVFI